MDALKILSIVYIKVFLTEDLKILQILFIHKQKLECPETLKPICFNTRAHLLKQSFQKTSRICHIKNIYFFKKWSFLFEGEFFLAWSSVREAEM